MSKKSLLAEIRKRLPHVRRLTPDQIAADRELHDTLDRIMAEPPDPAAPAPTPGLKPFEFDFGYYERFAAYLGRTDREIAETADLPR